MLIADIIFHVLAVILVVLGGVAIFWRWQHHESFAHCVIGEEACLLVRCVHSDLRKPFFRILLLFFLPTIWAGLLVFILSDPGSPNFWILLLAWMLSGEIFVMVIQVVFWGNLMLLGSKGVCYPVSDFGLSNLKSRARVYSKIESMKLATIHKKSVMAPFHTILHWEWPELEDKLILTLKCQGFLKASSKSLVFVVPRLSDVQRQEVLTVFDGMVKATQAGNRP